MRRVWCFSCAEMEPARIRMAAALVPVRETHFATTKDGEIDRRLIGCCSECLHDKNEFQKKNTDPVDINNPNLIYRHV